MQLSAWDVIWPCDPGAKPPKPKMWVCVEPDRLWFLRINSTEKDGSIELPKALHPFLDRDSWLHCHGELIETDEAKLLTLLERQGMPARRGILGAIAPGVRAEAIAAIERSKLLAATQKTSIVAALGGP
ncbi:MAG: hypothetical protein NZ555_11635 [Geminicoccaceae bacterium]|nr:hypothetical protein [Geminicoccaceae bacterium]